jgi:predicted O-methyltransferase YrrM
MEHFYKNLGEEWFTYPGLYSMIVERFPTDSHFVEVGTWKGMSAAYMAVEIKNSGKNIKFDCVDTWDFVPSQIEIPKDMFNNLYEIFIENIEPVKELITPIKALSWDGAIFYENESLDFIFIDAAHDYESVKKDINAWFPKLKKEGIIAGHDYTWCDDVRKAVNEFFEGKSIYESEGCWIYLNEE